MGQNLVIDVRFAGEGAATVDEETIIGSVYYHGSGDFRSALHGLSFIMGALEDSLKGPGSSELTFDGYQQEVVRTMYSTGARMHPKEASSFSLFENTEYEIVTEENLDRNEGLTTIDKETALTFLENPEIDLSIYIDTSDNTCRAWIDHIFEYSDKANYDEEYFNSLVDISKYIDVDMDINQLEELIEIVESVTQQMEVIGEEYFMFRANDNVLRIW